MSDVPLILRAPAILPPRPPRAAWMLPVAAALIALPPPAGAAEDVGTDEGFVFGIAQSLRWEDNLFRLPDGERPADGGSRSDRVSRSAASLGFRHAYGLQRVAAGFEIARRAYAEHDDLDSTTRSGNARWDWAAGRQWSGTALLLQREAQRSFEDTDRRVLSVNKLRRAGGDANFWWHPDWSLLVGGEHTRSRFSDARSDASEYDETAFETGVSYRPESGNLLALVARIADGDYPNRSPSASIDSGYEQRDLRLRADWTLTGISRLSGYVGYTRREYAHVSSLDFSGPTGRLAFDWAPTGKLSLRFVARREIGSEYEVIDNYVVTRGFGVEAKWAATDKIAVRAYGDRLRRDRGDLALSALDDEQRRTYGLSVDYMPLRTVTLTASAQRSKRDAAGRDVDFSADVYGLDARLDF